jgi:hypothetical protein
MKKITALLPSWFRSKGLVLATIGFVSAIQLEALAGSTFVGNYYYENAFKTLPTYKIGSQNPGCQTMGGGYVNTPGVYIPFPPNGFPSPNGTFVACSVNTNIAVPKLVVYKPYFQ